MGIEISEKQKKHDKYKSIKIIKLSIIN